MIYLASPFSHPLPAVEYQRFLETQRFVAHHLALGVPLFSPIVYTYQMSFTHKFPGDAEFWKFLNDEAVLRSSKVWVLQLQGWDKSLGVAHEIQTAERAMIEIEYKGPLTNGKDIQHRRARQTDDPRTVL